MSGTGEDGNVYTRVVIGGTEDRKRVVGWVPSEGSRGPDLVWETVQTGKFRDVRRRIIGITNVEVQISTLK